MLWPRGLLFWRVLLTVLFGLGGLLRVAAHTPFGSSVLVTIGENIEVGLTIGVEGSTAVLKAAAQSDDVIRSAHQARMGGTFHEFPAEFAARLFVLQSGGAELKATSLRVMSDGLEVLYIVQYPRPASGSLMVKARYFNDVESLTEGTLVVADENGRMLASALVSRHAPGLQLDLPAATPVAGPATGSVKTNVAVSPPTGTPRAAWVRPDFGALFKLGFTHILLGVDHLLFLCALLAGMRRVGPMLVVITSFTLAHSVTLALAALEWVTISSRVVEPMIAVSILVVGLENLLRREPPADRCWLAGGFGLIHGFGFAGALRETGLGRTGAEIVTPLLAFNLGVEVGQLVVAVPVVLLLLWLRRSPAFARFGPPTFAVAVIGVSVYWLLERLLFGR